MAEKQDKSATKWRCSDCDLWDYEGQGIGRCDGHYGTPMKDGPVPSWCKGPFFRKEEA